MRSIGTKVINGVLRPVLNGQFTFQIGLLDQGFWPDGIYTAPTDDALKFDIQKTKDLGYNLIRKHMKIEPARWYYWADKLGILVWQDMPAKFGSSTSANQEFEDELHEVVNEHLSSPSIIMWIVFNESWGQFDQARVASEVKNWDSNRLVDNMSGVNCCGSVDGGDGDTIDDHVYVGPDSPAPSSTRFATLGEFGGLGLAVAGHLWPGNGQAYAMEPDATTLTHHYVGLIGQVEGLITSKGLSAAVYTQTTDVENEINGLLTYDRAVVKMDVNRVKAVNTALIAASNR